MVDLHEDARRTSARAVNAIMTATYWEIGRRIVVFEQGGARRAAYGAMLLEKSAADLSLRFGRGFSRQNLQRFRQFYLAFPRSDLGVSFPLSWSHYTLLIRRARSREATQFYHSTHLHNSVGGDALRHAALS